MIRFFFNFQVQDLLWITRRLQAEISSDELKNYLENYVINNAEKLNESIAEDSKYIPMYRFQS